MKFTTKCRFISRINLPLARVACPLLLHGANHLVDDLRVVVASPNSRPRIFKAHRRHVVWTSWRPDFLSFSEIKIFSTFLVSIAENPKIFHKFLWHRFIAFADLRYVPPFSRFSVLIVEHLSKFSIAKRARGLFCRPFSQMFQAEKMLYD